MKRRTHSTVLCPICLNRFPWDAFPLVLQSPDGDQDLAQARGEGELAFRHRTRGAVRRCPADAQHPHYLPADYGSFGEPIIIAVIGAKGAGKTTLLAAIANALNSPSIELSSQLTFTPLDASLATRFNESYVYPLFSQGHQLAATRPGPTNIAYAVRGRDLGTNHNFAMAFFDVAGESLREAERFPSFIHAADGLIFMVDPCSVPGMTDPKDHFAYGSENAALFSAVCAHFAGLHPPERRFIPLPAAIIVAKSDLLLHRHPEVARWLLSEDLDLSRIEQESEDVYAFLAANNAAAYLRPAHSFIDTTLHFISATGAAVERSGLYPTGGVKPRRVLQPLLALLAMIGTIDRSWSRD